jgi:predicted nuclease with TOPRIM domain
VIEVAALDSSAFAALGTLIVAVVGAVFGWYKVKPEAESIATRTTLEVNEALRGELADGRVEAERLRGLLRKRDEELETLQRRFTTLRREFDDLEGELQSLRAATT